MTHTGSCRTVCSFSKIFVGLRAAWIPEQAGLRMRSFDTATCVSSLRVCCLRAYLIEA